MEPKFKEGQIVVIKKGVYFMFDKLTIRAGEIGKILEIDVFLLDTKGNVAYDYVVVVRDKPLFFYEDELAPYPSQESE